MRPKAILAVASGATAAIVVALTAPAAQGAADPTAAGAVVSADTLSALHRDLGLSADQARTRLARENTAGHADRVLRKAVGGSYGGAWFSGDTLVVGVTSSTHAAAVRAAGASPRIVARSEAQLDAVKDRLDAAAMLAPGGIPGWYVDVTTNSVVVKARAGAETAARSFVRVAAGADATTVRIEQSTEDPRPLIDVIGGNAYMIPEQGFRCSIGFSVGGGFVTAGHCGVTGNRTTGPGGTFRGSSFPGNDYAWVQVDAGNTPRPLVNTYPGTVTVNGSNQAPVGATVCRSGSTTGRHCGSVTAYNSTVNYPQGTVTGLIQTTVCAEPGDSGGSLLWNDQAQGVTSGGSGNCTSGGTTFFQPVNEILQVFGLQLVTGGGTPPTTPPTTPPGGTCTGYEARYTGTLASGGSQIQPNGTYYFAAAGTHRACLDGPSGTDFDLYLQRWNGSSWVGVAQATSPNPDELLTFNGTTGYYRYRVHAYSGSGTYTLAIDTP